MAPTLATSCAALDVLVPEALALRAVPMCAGTSGAAALSPEGANFSRGGPSKNWTPTLVALRTALDVLVPEALALRAVPMCAGTSGAAALSPEGANFPRGGPSGNCAPTFAALRKQR